MRERLRRFAEYRHRISMQMYLGIGASAALTLLAAMVAFYSFYQVTQQQEIVNEETVPNLAAAFGVAQHGNSLVAAAPRLTTAQSIEELNAVADEITGVRRLFEEQLDALASQSDGSGGEYETVRALAEDLINNVLLIRYNTLDLQLLREERDQLAAKLDILVDELTSLLAPALDNQLFYAMTGYQELGMPAAPRTEYFSEDELLLYRRLAELQSDAGEATLHLSDAFTVSDPSLIEPLREKFESAKGRIERNMAPLRGTEFHAVLTPIIEKIVEVGVGENNGFDLLDRELRLVEHEVELLAMNREQAVDLVAEVDALVGKARADSQAATVASAQAVETGRNLLIGITVVSVAGAVLIAWLYIGRGLLRRIELLSVWMRRMAGGDLETRMDVGGRDEVADMAAALDVFRQHALEVQRLNLVEQLAQELQGKNSELEEVLEDLRLAQDQIVVREKLAALGELTAGVAHEIRNPLNFIKNFSESSQELLVELKEVLEEEGDDQDDLIEEISEDLVANLERIRSHGDRANRIVHDMLMMGRGAGDWHPTNINLLLEEHSRLAYHSARALDPDFNLDIQHEFDENVGEIAVIPQDLARVFLNLVGNAAYATNQRRIDTGEELTSLSSYFPTLWLITERLEDCVRVQVKDNGGGISDDVLGKIFNPFFTTKPTGEGTGLGLAMCNDIIREHGGTIRVDVKPGEGTNMIVDLPLEPPEVGAGVEGEEEVATTTGD